MSTQQIAHELAQVTAEIESLLPKVGRMTRGERYDLESCMCRFTMLRTMQKQALGN